MGKDQQRINMVAQIISENGVSPTDARKLNAEGWTYEIRWKHESYLSNSYSRVEGDILSDADLEAAIKLAKERGIRYLLLTVRDVAATLRVAEPTVREWIKSGELPAIELGGRTGYRITEPDLEAFMQSRKKYLDRHQLPEKESATMRKAYEIMRGWDKEAGIPPRTPEDYDLDVSGSISAPDYEQWLNDLEVDDPKAIADGRRTWGLPILS